MKVLKIMLHPGEIRSKYDGDIHFIGGRQLAHLYGVLPTDHVVTFDIKNPTHRKEWQERHHDHFIHLFPSRDGNYENVHRFDEIEVDFERMRKSAKKLLAPIKTDEQ